MKQIYILKSFSPHFLTSLTKFHIISPKVTRNFAAEATPAAKKGDPTAQLRATGWTKKKKEEKSENKNEEKSADWESRVLEFLIKEGTPKVKSSGTLSEEEKTAYRKYQKEIQKYKEDHRRQVAKLEFRWKAMMAMPSHLREEAMRPDYTPVPESLFFWIPDYKVPSTYPPTRESVLQKRLERASSSTKLT